MVNLLVIKKTGRLFTYTYFFAKKYSNFYKLHKNTKLPGLDHMVQVFSLP